MLLPINPWASYKKEDMPAIDYSSRSDKEYFKHQIIVLGLCSLALVGASVLAIVSNLFKVCWCALTICAIPISVKLNIKEELRVGGKADYMYFPLPDRTLKKLLGDAMIRCLTMDRDSLAKYISGDYNAIVITALEKDKKGKTVSITIKMEE